MKAIRSRSESMDRADRIDLTVFLFSLLLLLAVPADAASVASNGSVLAVELQGPITPVSDDIVLAALERAAAEDSRALMILLDTPGGGLTETTEILKQIAETELPVIGYVYPDGAFAWSAGTIIMRQLYRGLQPV